LLSPVNPETDAKRCDRITIDAILWLDDDQSRAGLLLIKPRCFVEKECVRSCCAANGDICNSPRGFKEELLAE
jgi:hypothetical protein